MGLIEISAVDSQAGVLANLRLQLRKSLTEAQNPRQQLGRYAGLLQAIPAELPRAYAGLEGDIIE